MNFFMSEVDRKLFRFIGAHGKTLGVPLNPLEACYMDLMDKHITFIRPYVYIDLYHFNPDNWISDNYQQVI